MSALLLALALVATPPDVEGANVSTGVLGDGTGHLKLGGWQWQGGIIERTSPGYLAFIANNPAASTAASLYMLDAGPYRPAGYAWESSYAGFPYGRLRWDGTLFLYRGIVAGPGVGSGNTHLECAITAGMCYLGLVAHLPGGEQVPPRVHGALTVSNAEEMGPGSYMLQLRHGADKNALLVGGANPGNIWSSGDLIRLEGVNGMLSTREGMRLDPGVGAVRVLGASGLVMDDPDASMVGHVVERLPLADPSDARIPAAGDAEVWLEDGATPVLHFKVRTSSGIKTAALPLVTP